jgi:hypothetical protein
VLSVEMSQFLEGKRKMKRKIHIKLKPLASFPGIKGSFGGIILSM